MSSAGSIDSRTTAGSRLAVTLEEYARAEGRRCGHASDSLAWIVSTVGVCARSIAASLARAGIEDILGDAGSDNVQGEQQQKLDVISNDLMMAALGAQEGVAVLGSEEDDELLLTGSTDAEGNRFSVFFDPLDGSSNLDVGGSVGTIFSIFKIEGDDVSRLRPGREQVGAGYVLYGSSTIMVMTLGNGTHMFVLDRSAGTFVRTAENMQVPAQGKIYSVNEANEGGFPAGYREYLSDCHATGHSSRYAGAMVADVHRVLLKGGVFMYPPTAKAPNGKLRLMYECNPMAMLMTQAGGAASTGSGDVLDVQPDELHQRVPIMLGSRENVQTLLDLLQSEG